MPRRSLNFLGIVALIAAMLVGAFCYCAASGCPGLATSSVAAATARHCPLCRDLPSGGATGRPAPPLPGGWCPIEQPAVAAKNASPKQQQSIVAAAFAVVPAFVFPSKPSHDIARLTPRWHPPSCSLLDLHCALRC